MRLLSFLRGPRLDLLAMGLHLPDGLEGPGALERLVFQLERAEIDWTRLGPLVRFRKPGYRRRVLFRSGRWEMVLACWLPGQGSPIHGHGRSSGAARVLVGSLRETRFAPDGGAARWVSSETVRAGQVMVERPGDIHRVENISDAPGITLHVYSPPLARRMQVFPAPRPATPAPAEPYAPVLAT